MTPTLVQSTGVAHTRIYAYGAARGEIAVPNDDLVGPIDSSDEWSRQRTGIITRTRAVAGTDAIDLATDAAHPRIYAYGAARGEVAVPNDDLVGPIDSSDEWIRQ
ncbi:MAG: hypothetical protein ACRCSL_05370, partial [Microbacterium sp.]